ncbi:serine hydrolase [Lacinutrix iliipiscaria]|uniref:Beta-lactamase n=1 Tax=Lacinutrix iliipiscaria TaxID=1230532 RepID=A0ABW5WRU6_9FLAO
MKKLVFVFSLLFISFTLQAQDNLISSEVKEHIKARIETKTDVAIAMGFIDGDAVEYYSAGQTALENGTDVDEHSVFEIGSISKTFTTVLLSQKIIAGEMSLEDPISKYLPSTVKTPARNGKNITILDLATHTSALPRMPNNFTPKNPNNPFVDYTYEQLYDFLSNHELNRDIGVQYEYSNLGMGLLGHILELQSGKTFEQLLIDNIAKPLGMNDTAIALNESMKKRLAKGHDGLAEVENWDIITMAGAGGIRSTVSDMVKYIQANMGVTKSSFYNAMQLSHESAYKNKENNYEIGLAWHYENDKEVIWHNGRTGGYSSFAGFVPKTNKGVVILTNNTADIGALSFRSLGGPTPLVAPKKSIVTLLKKEIQTSGIDSAIALYMSEKSNAATEYNFNEQALNTLGYELLNGEALDDALAIFKLNVNMYPNASNPYDSLGEAYLAKGDSVLAKKNYEKSLELNPANTNAVSVLESMGVKNVVKEVVIPQDVLDTYVGKYELAPGFIITVTRKENQMFAQATGQSQFEIFASAQNKFYLKVVEANVEFNVDESGEVTSMTLYQGGQVLPGKKLDE